MKPTPLTVAAVRGLVYALLAGGLQLALSEGDVSWRTAVAAVAPFVLRWLGEGFALDRNDGRQANVLGAGPPPRR